MAWDNANVIEIVRSDISAAKPKVVIVDFGGTLSVIRSGWMDVMVPMCIEHLSALNTGEPEAKLTEVVEEFVWRLTGKDPLALCVAKNSVDGRARDRYFRLIPTN